MRCLALALSVSILSALLVVRLASSAPTDDTPGQTPRKMIECRVSLGSSSVEKHVELCITDEKLLRKLIEAPLRVAKSDPQPARYEPVAGVTIEFADGQADGFVVFRSWKHFKQGDQYKIADFSMLQNESKQSLERALKEIK